LHAGSQSIAFLDVRGLRTRYPFIAMVRQADLLSLIVAEANQWPTFRVITGARAEALLQNERGQVHGVRYRARDGTHDVQAKLVVGADGRFSRVRTLAQLRPIRTAPAFDLLWFRVPREPSDRGGGVYLGRRGWLVLLNRGTAWQVAYSLPKGGFAALRGAGLEELDRSVSEMAPWLAGRAGAVRTWQETGLLSVEVNHVRQWYRPGVLLIGDAAHTMSPVAGVGISLAIQDAVVAANVLAAPLRRGSPGLAELAEIQRRREWPIRIVQAYQGLMHRWLAHEQTRQTPSVPRALRLHAQVAPLRDLVARVFGLGVWPVRLEV
jgi:2-polyprenyl-6-methoxyphenol hydroxylase-like FAD-dependent oxidoreductase